MLDNDAYASPTPAGGKGRSAERALRSAIVHCVLAPGERLSEARLAHEFALGRGAVRAALARLQAAGVRLGQRPQRLVGLADLGR